MSNVVFSELQKAFNLAHKAQQNAEYSLAARNVFRAIEHHIWVAAGKPDVCGALAEIEQEGK